MSVLVVITCKILAYDRHSVNSKKAKVRYEYLLNPQIIILIVYFVSLIDFVHTYRQRI